MDFGKSRRLFMFFLLILFSCLFSSVSSEYSFSIVGKDLVDLIPEESVLQLFQKWKEKHQKGYNHEEEAQKRFENFRRNLFYVIEKNTNRKLHSHHQVGLNKFADLSKDEFREHFLSKNQRCLPGYYKRRNSGTCYAPPSLDWRKKSIATSIYKDHSDCGIRRALSSIGSLEWIHAIISGELLGFLEQELSTDCDRTKHLYDEVNAEESLEWVVSNSGIDSPEDYGYVGQNDTSTIIKMKSKVAFFDGLDKTSGGLICAIVQRPSGVCMDASAMDLQLYTGGIYDGECSNNPEDGNHGVLIVGYGSEDAKDYWIVKNSWGKDWGIGGFFYMRRTSYSPFGICGTNSIPSERSNEQDSPPPPDQEPPPPPTQLDATPPPPRTELDVPPPPPSKFDTPTPSHSQPFPSEEPPSPPSELETPTPSYTPPPPSEFDIPPPPPLEIKAPPPPSEFETPPPSLVPPPTFEPPPELETPPPPSIPLPTFEPPPPSEFETPPPPPSLFSPPPPSELKTPPPSSTPPPPLVIYTPPPPSISPPTFEPPPPSKFETPLPPSKIKAPPPPKLETPPTPSAPPPPEEIESPPPPSIPPPIFEPPPPESEAPYIPPPSLSPPLTPISPPPPAPAPAPSPSPPFSSPPPPTPTLPPPSISPPPSPPMAIPPPSPSQSPPILPPPFVSPPPSPSQSPPIVPPTPSFPPPPPPSFPPPIIPPPIPPPPSISPPVAPISPPPTPSQPSTPPVQPFSPPPPTTPLPSECGDVAACSSRDSCCCYMEMYEICLIYGCCPFKNAICCAGSKLCCPNVYPVCDVKEKRCLKSKGDVLGVDASKIHIATYKFPWTTSEKERQKHQHPPWKWSRLAAMH